MGAKLFSPPRAFPSPREDSGFDSRRALPNHSGGTARDSHPLPLAATIEVTAHGVVDVGKMVTSARVTVKRGDTVAVVNAASNSHCGSEKSPKLRRQDHFASRDREPVWTAALRAQLSATPISITAKIS